LSDGDGVTDDDGTDLRQCERLYGSSDLRAVIKRQLSSREIKALGLR